MITRGVARMPDARTDWKASRLSAKPANDEPLDADRLEFAHASAVSIVANNYDSGWMLNGREPGEASGLKSKLRNLDRSNKRNRRNACERL